MAKTKEISRRIKSISSTKKITKAMEMVSAAKMRKAVEAVLKTRMYANLSWATILRLAGLFTSRDEAPHELLARRLEVKKAAVVVITSNRGLCGGFNAAIINKVKDSLKKHNYPTDLILVGKKGVVLHYQGFQIAAEFPKADLALNPTETNPIAKMLVADFLAGKYDKVLVAYTDFVNPVKQVPRLKQILPVDISLEENYLGTVDAGSKSAADIKEAENLKNQVSEIQGAIEYLFEPSPQIVLNQIIPKLIEVQLFQALLESNAAEHSARMTSMHQATEAASDMVSELTLFYNKARQASITAEIAEISAGANALAE